MAMLDLSSLKESDWNERLLATKSSRVWFKKEMANLMRKDLAKFWELVDAAKRFCPQIFSQPWTAAHGSALAIGGIEASTKLVEEGIARDGKEFIRQAFVEFYERSDMASIKEAIAECERMGAGRQGKAKQFEDFCSYANWRRIAKNERGFAPLREEYRSLGAQNPYKIDRRWLAASAEHSARHSKEEVEKHALEALSILARDERFDYAICEKWVEKNEWLSILARRTWRDKLADMVSKASRSESVAKRKI